MLHLKCKGQEMKVDVDERIADKYINANKVHFEFCERWADMLITAQFTQKQKDAETGELEDKTYNVVVDDVTGTVTMPNEIMAGEVFISAFGEHPTTGVRITSIPIKKTVDKSGFVGDGDTPIPPTPDLYAQLIAKMGASIPTPNGANKQLITNANGSTAWADQRILSIGNFATGAVVGMGANKNVVHGTHATALGSSTQATGSMSAAIGSAAKASGNAAFACNSLTKASGKASFAKGDNTEANGENSSAEGSYTIADGANQHVQGKYNVKDAAGKYAHIVGNGEGNTQRSNAHTLDWDGNAWFKGKVYVGGTSMDDAVELGAGGEVDEDAVREIVEDALTEAKDSGEFDGADGYSPTVTLTRKSNGVQIDVQNKDGKQSATVYDGQGGEGGGGGLPTGGDPNMMLVTDGEGNANWDERTHWKEGGKIDYFPESVISGNGVQYEIKIPFAQRLVEGETYTVTINGADYVSTAKESVSEGVALLILGNTSMANGEDTGEPYTLMHIPPEIAATMGVYGMLVADTGGASEVTLRVWKDGTIYHKLDPNYLPIPMTSGAVDILPETTAEGEEGMLVITTPFASKIVVGKTYTVTYNGADYTCTAFETPMDEEGGLMAPSLGNHAAFGGEDTGEPFIIAYIPLEMVEMVGGYGMVMDMTEASSATVRIQDEGDVKIDNSALDMDWIAKYDDVGETIVAETVGQGNGAEVAAADTSFFVEGAAFIAYVDNVRYDLTVVNYEGQLAAGNLGLVFPGAPGKGEPFYITAKEGKLTFFRAWSDDNDALHTIAVYLPGSSQRVPNQKLPNAFLPGTDVYYVDLANGEVNRGFDEIVSAYNLGRTVCCRIYDDMTSDSKLYYLTRVAVYNGKIYFSNFLDGEMTEITIDRYDRETEKYNKVTITRTSLTAST